MVAPPRCRDQAELLEAFAVPVAVLQDAEALSVAAAALVEDLVADGVRYAEIRFAPASHARGGLSLDGVIRGGRRWRSRTGCVQRRLRACPSTSASSRSRCARTRRSDPWRWPRGRGGPRRWVSSGSTWPAGGDRTGSRRRTCRRSAAPARAVWPSPSMPASGVAPPRSGRRSPSEPRRIAHGGPAIDDPALMRELTARGITLDLCPTSNVQAALVERIDDHPLPRLLRAGVPVTLSTDDRTVSATTLTEEALARAGPAGPDAGGARRPPAARAAGRVPAP